MAPRAPTLLSLISSTSYPPLPSVEELEQLRNALEAQAASVAVRSAAVGEDNRKKDKKRKDREATDDRERAALAANERSGLALDAVERRRMGNDDVKVKRERGELAVGSVSPDRAESPAPSNASSASFRPHGNQTTYGNGHKKKKVKRVLDSEDEGTRELTRAKIN